ncbi:gustatory receptor 23a-like [Sitodiplosis mosellana]|uniref:gustatory receptor 23a-like n=1 Tax=Sitodiplosis mosellana TaxID=263140 RepID=UPI002444B200|nr:gustatory receptor 23a-like [Sitodiplosis mosellana]
MLGAMVFYCSSCSRQTRFLGSYLHRIKQSNENDPQNDLIREFSIQLLHDPIFISANGVFHIDFNLIGSLIALTITYMVILIQFEMSTRGKPIRKPIMKPMENGTKQLIH